MPKLIYRAPKAISDSEVMPACRTSIAEDESIHIAFL
jgi:hypothetical protein